MSGSEDSRPEKDEGTEGMRREGEEESPSPKGASETEDDDDDGSSLMGVSQLGITFGEAGAQEADSQSRKPSGGRPDSALAGLLKDMGKLPADEALDIVREIAAELESTWDQEVARRDVRPGNIVVKASGEVRIVSPEEGGRLPGSVPSTDPICAEHNYVSPEEVKGAAVDGRSDVFALGVLLFRMVTGEFPFEGEDGEAISKARVGQRPRRASEVNPDITDAVADVVETMLAEDLAFRYPNPTEVLHDVKLIVEGPEPESDVGTTIMEKPGAETETPATGTPAILAGGTPRKGSPPPSQAPTDMFKFDDTKKSAPARKDAAAGGGLEKMAARARKPHVVHRRPGVVAAMVAVVGAGALALLVVGVLMWNRLASSDARPSATDALETEAQGRYEELLGAYGAGEYGRVLEQMDSLGDKYAGTTRAGQLKALRKMAAGKLAEARKREEEREKERRELAALEAAATGFYQAREKEHERGEYQAVAAAIEAAGERYAATKHADKIASMGRRAKEDLKEAERRARSEAEMERLYREFLDRAKEETEAGDYESALATLKQARALKESDELALLAARATRMRCLVLGPAAEEEGRLGEALGHYRKALEIEHDEKLAARVAELSREVGFHSLVADAEAHESQDDWQGALDCYLKALSLAGDDDKRSVQSAIDRVQAEIRYRDVLGEAQGALEAGRWLAVIELAKKVLEIKPGDREATRLIGAAKKLEPKKKVTNSMGMELVLVRGGEFVMGGLSGDRDEKPAHKVRLDPFYIGVHEVTNAQFEAFAPERKKQRTKYSPDDNTPVVLVSWKEALAFCTWLSEMEGSEYRLPTEAEWEMAARGKEGGTYAWGHESPGADGTWRCNIATGAEQASWDRDGHRYASPVGSYARFDSPYGVQDLGGNVWEWCIDWYRSDYYSSVNAPNPAGPQSGKQRVLRGGSFANGARAARSTNRAAKAPGYREASIGFRCVRVLGGDYQPDWAGSSHE